VNAGGFDALLEGYNTIIGGVLKAIGLAVIAQESCPLCWLKANCHCGKADCAERYEKRIEHAADSALAEAVWLGLIQTQ